MLHLTLNTGHAMTVPPGKVTPQAIRILGPMVVKRGDFVPHFAPWRTVITLADGHALFDIRRGREEAVTLNAVAWTADGAAAAWRGIERAYLATADELAAKGLALDLEMPDMPEPIPWLVTWVLPAAGILASRNDISWMADFEQCLAATIIRKATHQPPP
jgi:hypothetical protein